MSAKSKASSSNQKQERRRSPRVPILETFSVFAVIPKKGPYRLRVHDLSAIGVRFDLDLEDEAEPLNLKSGEKLDFHLYLNQSLFLPLRLQVVRVQEEKQVRTLGAEFIELEDAAREAVASFVGMLEAIAEVGVVTPSEVR